MVMQYGRKVRNKIEEYFCREFDTKLENPFHVHEFSKLFRDLWVDILQEYVYVVVLVEISRFLLYTNCTKFIICTYEMKICFYRCVR